MTPRVTVATTDDKPGFLRLAGQVEPWFGAMVEVPGFHRALDRTIAAGRALCVRDEQSDGLLGGMMFGGAGPRFHIDWLVVGESGRRGGVGRVLVAEALRRFVTPPARIDVVTFGVDHPAARDSGARVFYERLGFAPGERAPRGPEGGPRQYYTLDLPRGDADR